MTSKFESDSGANLRGRMQGVRSPHSTPHNHPHPYPPSLRWPGSFLMQLARENNDILSLLTHSLYLCLTLGAQTLMLTIALFIRARTLRSRHSKSTRSNSRKLIAFISTVTCWSVSLEQRAPHVMITARLVTRTQEEGAQTSHMTEVRHQFIWGLVHFRSKMQQQKKNKVSIHFFIQQKYLDPIEIISVAVRFYLPHAVKYLQTELTQDSFFTRFRCSNFKKCRYI